MSTMAHTKLKDLRQDMARMAQEDFAREAGLRVSTYRNIEQGRATTYSKAMAILTTLNRLRADRGLSQVTLEDLGINLA